MNAGKTKNKGLAQRKRASRSPAAKPTASKPRIVTASLCSDASCPLCLCRGVSLGKYHGFRAFLQEPTGKGRDSALRVGCRTFRSPTAAQAHWKGGKNRYDDPRPRAPELIAKATAVAKQMRWRWGRA